MSADSKDDGLVGLQKTRLTGLREYPYNGCRIPV